MKSKTGSLAWLPCLAWLAIASSAHAVPFRAVPDERPLAAVTDMTGTLSAADKAVINGAARKARTNGELYVAVVSSIEGMASRPYAMALFNRLRLDTRTRNRGVLLMASLGDRKAEIVLGDGYPGSASIVTDEIMRDVVVANFKKRDPRAALVLGASALVDRLVLAGDAADTPPPSPPPDAAEAVTEDVLIINLPASTTSGPPGVGSAWEWTRGVAEAHPWPFYAGLGVLGLGLLAGVRRVLRHRPRACYQCSQRMVLLDEAREDAYLEDGQRAEESVGSVDYDVWLCQACRSVLVLRYGTFFSRYTSCLSCQARTRWINTVTLQRPTTSSDGLEEVEEQCMSCGYHNSYRRRTPQLSDRDSGSGGGFASHGGSDFPGDSGRRSGGRSSGGGSSGSW